MAQQAKKKAVRSGGRSNQVAAQAPQPSEVGLAQLKKLELERDTALRKLLIAEQRIAELETVQDQVVNRIDWVIDSLHNLRDETS